MDFSFKDVASVMNLGISFPFKKIYLLIPMVNNLFSLVPVDNAAVDEQNDKNIGFNGGNCLTIDQNELENNSFPLFRAHFELKSSKVESIYHSRRHWHCVIGLLLSRLFFRHSHRLESDTVEYRWL